MRRLLGTCLAVGLTLLYSRAAEARPSLELSTTLGGADASEYLVRVANPDPREEKGVLELRNSNESRVVTRMAFSVPANATGYFRLPAERGQRVDAYAITSEGTFRAQDRYSGGDPGQLVFDIPPQDSQRLQELRVHTRNTILVTHAVFDETTPVLTRRAAVYDSAALVMVRASVLAALPAAEREALSTWVRTGGAIALSVKDDDLASVDDALGVKVARRLHPGEFGLTTELGLGTVYVLPLDPWTGDVSSGIAVQEKLAKLVEDRHVPRHLTGGFFSDSTPLPLLDPNRGYRSVMALAGVLLVAQALIAAFAFRRLAIRRGMGPAYRFVVGSSVVSFAAVIGLGVYAKGGFRARARELSFADVASGESVAWVERYRTYFSGYYRTVSVTPRDPSNDLTGHDSQAVLRLDDAHGVVVLDDLAVHPWETTAVTERGTTTLGGGIKLEFGTDGNVIVHNASGRVLRHVVVSKPDGTCFAFGEIADGADKTSQTPILCTDLGPEWSAVNGMLSSQQYLTPYHLVLIGQVEDEPTTIDDFRMEKRTMVIRVMGGAS